MAANVRDEPGLRYLTEKIVYKNRSVEHTKHIQIFTLPLGSDKSVYIQEGRRGCSCHEETL